MLFFNHEFKLSILRAATSEWYLRYSNIVFSLKKQIYKQMKNLSLTKQKQPMTLLIWLSQKNNLKKRKYSWLFTAFKLHVMENTDS